MRVGTGILGLLLGGALLLGPGVARADEVDDAFAQGHQAAAAGDWDGAIEAYERAQSLLPHDSSMLSYDLGTAHAHAGHLGRATYHLRRALALEAGLTAELATSVRHNLAEVRRRAELQAASSGAQIDRPEGWWDVMVQVLRGRAVGWISLLCGWAFLAAVGFRWLRQRGGISPAQQSINSALLWVLGGAYVFLGVAHWQAARADRLAPRAIVLQDALEVREGPGQHRDVAFTVQGGSRVRIVQQTPGWSSIRLSGLTGWVPQSAVAKLEPTSRVR